MFLLFFCNTPPTCDHHLQLGLCWAITMHKSQGQTSDKVVIDLASMYLVPRYVYVGTYVPGLHPPPKKRTEGLLKLLQKNKVKNNLNTELTEMGVFSAVAGNQLPNQLQKRVLPALFHLRCRSQSHHRSARGRTRLTTVTSISCRSF